MVLTATMTIKAVKRSSLKKYTQTKLDHRINVIANKKNNVSEAIRVFTRWKKDEETTITDMKRVVKKYTSLPDSSEKRKVLEKANKRKNQAKKDIQYHKKDLKTLNDQLKFLEKEIKKALEYWVIPSRK